MFNKNKLELIDFSQGIRASEIQHNFDALQSQLNKERVSVAGRGISYGFEFDLQEFKLTIKEGCLIDDIGREVFIDKTEIEIEKPILINRIERFIRSDADGRLNLEEIPYATNREMPVESLGLPNGEFPSYNKTGLKVTLSGLTGEAANVRISLVDGKVVQIDPKLGALNGVDLDVTYNHTFRRRDVVFIDKNFKIQHRLGITSPSPSVPHLEKDEYIYILGYIQVDSMTSIGETIRATASIVKEFKSIRNVYTDSDNNLYLCGTPFDAIKIIHTIEPENPIDGTIWYDSYTNKLKVWRHTDVFNFAGSYTHTGVITDQLRIKTTVPYLYGAEQLEVYINDKRVINSDLIEGVDLVEDEINSGIAYSSEFKITRAVRPYDKITYKIERFDGFAEWVSVNDMSYVELTERKIWSPEMLENNTMDKEFDMQHFFFDYVADMNMRFVPGTNALEIMIDQVMLHSDQFDEITLYDAIAGADAGKIRILLERYYGYQGEISVEKLHEQFENIGVGFKLNAPLLKNSYVEATVAHRVNTNPLANRFQRSATFVAEGYEEYLEYVAHKNQTVFQTPMFKTKVKFRYEENQLEVFVNGLRLIRGRDYLEIPDTNSIKGSNIDRFKINESYGLKSGDIVEYRISYSIYSYDHVESLLSSYTQDLNSMKQIVNDAVTNINATVQQIESKIEIVDGQIENLKGIEESIQDRFMEKDALIGKQNLEADIYSGTIDSCFYETIQVNASRPQINITNICNNRDFLQVFNISGQGGNRILRRDVEYKIIVQQGHVLLKVETDSVEPGNFLYLTGMRFNRA